MIVDLNDTKNLDMAETDYEFRKLKSNKLMTEINKRKQEQNFMIIPMSIYNILENRFNKKIQNKMARKEKNFDF